MKKKLHISINDVILAFLFISFYIPFSYAVPGYIYTIWRLFFSFVTGLSITMIVSTSKLWKISRGFFFTLLYYSWMFLATTFLTENGELKTFNYIRCIGFVSFLEYSLNSHSKKTVLRAFLIASIGMSLVQFLSFMKYADVVGGMRANTIFYQGDVLITNTSQNWYFLTYDNDSIYYFLPTIAILVYYSVRVNKTIRKYTLLYILFILYMYIYKMAITALLAMIVLIGAFIFLILSRHRHYKSFLVRKILNPTFSVVCGLFIDIIPIVVVGSGVVAWFSSYFGKKASFTGRDIIWEKSIEYISQHLLLGNGFENPVITVNKINQTHCHNLILENLYVGGLVGFVLFVCIVLSYRPRGKDAFMTSIFSALILVYFIVGTMDWLLYNPIPMALFIFNYYLNDERKYSIGEKTNILMFARK